jgi:hypothetical protein
MDNNTIQAKWPVLKEAIMKAHPEFTSEELLCELGKEAETLLRIQAKLGKTEKEIRDWLSIIG